MLYFAEVGGRHNVVCFRNKANYIINEKWYTNERDTVEDETERIVKTAARLIQAQIRETEYSLTLYPSNDEIKNTNSRQKASSTTVTEFPKNFYSIKIEANEHWPEHCASITAKVSNDAYYFWTRC